MNTNDHPNNKEVDAILNNAIEYTINEKENKFISCADLFDTDPPAQQFIFSPIIPAVGICAVAGSSDTGKSALLRQIAFCLASGKDFLNFKNTAEKKHVLIVSTEDNKDDFHRLMKIQNKTLNLTRADFSNINVLFECENVAEAIKTQLESNPEIGLVIIDAFSDIFSSSNEMDMNNSTSVRRVLSEYHKLTNEFKVCIAFLHHTTKASERAAAGKNNLSGSQAFEAKARLVIELRNDPEDDNLKHLCIVKGNYLTSEYKRESYEMEFSNLIFSLTGNRRDFSEIKKDSNEKSTSEKRREEEAIKRNVFQTILQGRNLKPSQLCEEYASLTGKTERTAWRHFNDMLNSGFLVKFNDKIKLKQ